MSRWYSYINSAKQIIETYKGKKPLAAFLKDHFRQYAKYGSKDRKYIAHLCYCYYRLGHSLPDISTDQKIKTALFLCTDEASEWQILFDETWVWAWSKNLAERIDFIKGFYPDFNFAMGYNIGSGQSIKDKTITRTYDLTVPKISALSITAGIAFGIGW